MLMKGSTKVKEIYLDNSATTKPSSEVLEGMIQYYKQYYGNPSSLHKKGIEAEKGIKHTREIITNFLGMNDGKFVFTSGGTEANNLAIKGFVHRNKVKGNHIITTSIEHSSVLNVFKDLEDQDFRVTYLNADNKGRISLEELRNEICEDTILVSIMMVNNEIGTIQPIKEISSIMKEKGNKCKLHVDGVQAFGKIPCNMEELDVDFFTISAHKFHGPKGVGGLFIKKKTLIYPQIIGGGQENDLRSGTENVPGIVGMGVAIEGVKDNLKNNMNYLYDLREKILKGILDEIPHVKINGPKNKLEIAPHILNISFEGIRGEVLLHSLEQDSIYVSTGSACSSKDRDKSHVLKNIGLSKNLIEGTIRISLSTYNTEDEVKVFINKLKKHVKNLRNIFGR